MDAASAVLLTVGGALIGFLLSVLGAGGSILLLPLLVSGAALPTREAVPLSLLVVMLLAVASLVPYARQGRFAPGPALVLGVPALAGSWIGGSWVKAGLVPEAAQLGVFAVSALLASWLLTRRRVTGAGTGRASSSGRPLLLALQGVLVGLLTGIAGVGGGFAIVPALVLLAGLPMATACGTSLLLIALNALVALGALGHWPSASLPLILPLLTGGAIGAAGGQRLAPHLSDRRLRQGFSLLLIGSALLSGLEAWRRLERPPPPGLPDAPAPPRPGLPSAGSASPVSPDPDQVRLPPPGVHQPPVASAEGIFRSAWIPPPGPRGASWPMPGPSP